MIALICKDPFRLFFPVAIASLLYGSGLWIAYSIFKIGNLPYVEHINLFLGGFLYYSILGFLLTAIPQFTSTKFLSKWELFKFCLVIFGSSVFQFIENDFFFWLSIFLGWTFLLIFGIRRFLSRKQNPPYTFVFVGTGVLFGLFGSLFILLSDYQFRLFGFLENWGKLFFYDAMVTSFILGIGGRLIPGILGFVEIVKKQRGVYESPDPFFRVVPIDIFFSLFFFLMSFFLEGNNFDRLGFIFRALVVTYFSFKYWRLHEAIKTGKWHGRVLKLSCYLLLVASWLLCFESENSIHIKHLIYIGTYCLMTLMIASRVVIAHGNEGLDIEYSRMPYLIIGFLLTSASIMRATAYLFLDSYEGHLGHAAIFLFSGALFWTIGFFKKIFDLHLEE